MEKKQTSEITRSAIKEPVKLQLWGMAAGRCEICNKLLYLDSYFGDNVNFAENAHIHAVGSAGPRHKDDMTQEEINCVDNLMLLCAEHHHLIDTKPESYPDERLVDLKKAHEERIRKLTEIQEDASCRMVTFFSNIDHAEVFSATNLLRNAVVKDKMYPQQDEPIRLHDGLDTKYIPSAEEFQRKAEDLASQVKLFFSSIVKKDDTIAIFAFAPMPLLIKLGTLLCDQLNVHVFQCHREGDRWAWPKDSSEVDYIIKKTQTASETNIALVIDLSAVIVDRRITAVLGECCTIYHLTIEQPNRLFVRNKEIQNAFVRSFRSVMELIRNEHPNATNIKLFPAVPTSLAVRAGMDIMPKVDLPIIVYDQLGEGPDFKETITIGG